MLDKRSKKISFFFLPRWFNRIWSRFYAVILVVWKYTELFILKVTLCYLKYQPDITWWLVWFVGLERHIYNKVSLKLQAFARKICNAIEMKKNNSTSRTEKPFFIYFDCKHCEHCIQNTEHWTATQNTAVQKKNYSRFFFICQFHIDTIYVWRIKA